MNGFIEIHCTNGVRRLINTRYIEEIVEENAEMCSIYMAFNVPDAYEQDHFHVIDDYKELIDKIKNCMGVSK